MTGFQTEVRRELRAPEEVATEQPVEINVSLHPAVAYQLAQFAKRSTFITFYEFTEAHLSDDERKLRAYQMIAGIEAVGAALAKAGHAPR
jgi:hypothetical protein